MLSCDCQVAGIKASRGSCHLSGGPRFVALCVDMGLARVSNKNKVGAGRRREVVPVTSMLWG